MKALLILCLVALLPGCSSFKLGTVAYIPFGVAASLQVAPMPQPGAENAPAAPKPPGT